MHKGTRPIFMQYLYKQIILARTLFKRLSWITYGCNNGERYFRKKTKTKQRNLWWKHVWTSIDHWGRKTRYTSQNTTKMRKLGVVAALVILKKLKLFIASYLCKLRNSEWSTASTRHCTCSKIILWIKLPQVASVFSSMKETLPCVITRFWKAQLRCDVPCQHN